LNLLALFLVNLANFCLSFQRTFCHFIKTLYCSFRHFHFFLLCALLFFLSINFGCSLLLLFKDLEMHHYDILNLSTFFNEVIHCLHLLAFAIYHKFGYVVFPFSFVSRNLKFFILISSVTHCLIKSVLFSLHEFVYFLKFLWMLIFIFIP
jgi:hypothetical protein